MTAEDRDEGQPQLDYPEDGAYVLTDQQLTDWLKDAPRWQVDAQLHRLRETSSQGYRCWEENHLGRIRMAREQAGRLAELEQQRLGLRLPVVPDLPPYRRAYDHARLQLAASVITAAARLIDYLSRSRA